MYHLVLGTLSFTHYTRLSSSQVFPGQKLQTRIISAFLL